MSMMMIGGLFMVGALLGAFAAYAPYVFAVVR